MMAISGTNVSSIPTPAMRPSTTKPSTRLPPSPTASKAAVVTDVTGPVKNASSAPCSGAATVVVRAKTAHMTPRKITGPSSGGGHPAVDPVGPRLALLVGAGGGQLGRVGDPGEDRLGAGEVVVGVEARGQVARWRWVGTTVQSAGQSARQPPTVAGARDRGWADGAGQGVADRLREGADVPAPWVQPDHRGAQSLGEDGVVDLDAPAGGDVGHRQGDDHRHRQLAHVRGEHQRAPEVRGVADDHDGVDLVAAVQQIRGQGLVGGHRVQRVGAGQVGQGELAERRVGPAPGADLDAGPRVVADGATRAGEGVEERGLPGVGAAHEGDAACARAGRLAGRLVAAGDRVSHARAPRRRPRCWPGSGARRRSGRRRWPGSPRRRSSGTGSAARRRVGCPARRAGGDAHPWIGCGPSDGQRLPGAGGVQRHGHTVPLGKACLIGPLVPAQPG